MFSMTVGRFNMLYFAGSVWRDVAAIECWKSHIFPHATSQTRFLIEIVSRRISPNE